MISRDTFKARWLAYATKAGSPGNSAEIRLIMVMKGTGQFTGPDSMVVDYIFELYLPMSTPTEMGFPTQARHVMTIPETGTLTTSGKRVLP
jgi:hypothetical protein